MAAGSPATGATPATRVTPEAPIPPEALTPPIPPEASNRCRAIGLTRPGQPLHGLPDDFTLRPEDIPDQPEEDAAGKDLPAEVMRALTGHLDQLEASSGTDVRTAVELMMDTGRRPDEIATLMLDCLGTDPDGEPVLIYDNHKEHRKGRRLPIAAATATIITEQQERVRVRFPGTQDSQLRLIPSPARNPVGRRNMSEDWISACHRAWVDGLPEVAVPTAVDRQALFKRIEEEKGVGG